MKYYGTGYVADMLGVCRLTIRRYCQNNEIPYSIRTVGGTYRFSESDVKSIIEMMTRKDDTDGTLE